MRFVGPSRPQAAQPALAVVLITMLAGAIGANAFALAPLAHGLQGRHRLGLSSGTTVTLHAAAGNGSPPSARTDCPGSRCGPSGACRRG
jgi:hypothetical protein